MSYMSNVSTARSLNRVWNGIEVLNDSACVHLHCVRRAAC